MCLQYKGKKLKTIDLVLLELEKNRGTFISGQSIATQLNLTRASVWRAVKQLREQNYLIEGSTKLGYCLSTEREQLSLQSILPFLEKYNAPQTEVIYYPTIDSTNKEAKRLSLEHAEHGTIVVADEQSHGLGRNGKSFFSPLGNGIYLSMILKPKVDASLALKVTSMAAVAVCRTLKQTLNLEGRIKWVNDVYLNNLKVCGILTEGVTGFESRKVETIVVGIGINYQEGESGFPNDLKEIATTLFKKDEKPTISKSELIGSLVASLRKLVDNLDDNSYIEEYRQLSLVIGKNVKVIQGDVAYEAIAEAIDDNGFLTVRLEDNTLKVLQSGEISIRRATNKSW